MKSKHVISFRWTHQIPNGILRVKCILRTIENYFDGAFTSNDSQTKWAKLSREKM